MGKGSFTTDTSDEHGKNRRVHPRYPWQTFRVLRTPIGEAEPLPYLYSCPFAVIRG
jgi:hypothetical protein